MRTQDLVMPYPGAESAIGLAHRMHADGVENIVIAMVLNQRGWTHVIGKRRAKFTAKDVASLLLKTEQAVKK